MRRRVSGLLKTVSILIITWLLAARAWNAFVQRQMVTRYRACELSADEETEYRKAQAYNRALYEAGPDHIGEYAARTNRNADADGYGSADDEEYESLLDAGKDGVMGYVEVPSVGVSIPVYHYASEASLSKGLGHLYGSSLPVGGKNTHAVITGHRGLPSSRLFTDLDKVKKGDTFRVHVLNRDLYYRVDQIRTVLPDDTDDLAIREGEDLCTLLTCTPYGVNDHRLLVRGTRIPAPEAQRQADRNLPEKLYGFFSSWQVTIAAGVLALVLAAALLKKIWKPERRKQ